MPAGWVAAGASLYSAINSANASSSAAQQQQAGSNAAIQAQQQQFSQTQQNLAPYRSAGSSALNQMMQLMGLPGISLGSSGGGMRPNQLNLGAGGMQNPMSQGSQAYNAAMQGNNGYGFDQGFSNNGGFISFNGGNGSQYGQFGALHDPNQTTGTLATGGPAMGGHRGHTYLVGERGPELLTMAPGANGFVHNNSATMQMLRQGQMMAPPPGRAAGGAVSGDSVTDPGFDPHLGGQGLAMTANQGMAPAPMAQQAAAAPFNPAGGNNTALTGGMTPDQIMKMNPAYQFAFQQGIQGLQNTALAKGTGLSGGFLKTAEQYGQGLASQTFQNIYGDLNTLASLGENASAMTGTLGQAAASNIGSSYMYGGNAGAAGTIGSANAYNQGLGNLAYLYGAYGGYNSPGPVNNLNVAPNVGSPLINSPPIYGQGGG